MTQTRQRIMELEQKIYNDKLAVKIQYGVLVGRAKKSFQSPVTAGGAALLGFLFAPRSKKGQKKIAASAATPLIGLLGLWMQRATRWYSLAQKFSFLSPILASVGKAGFLAKLLGK